MKKTKRGTTHIAAPKKIWGRYADGNWSSAIGAIFMLHFAPFFVFFCHVCIMQYDGSLLQQLRAIVYSKGLSFAWFPSISWRACFLYFIWYFSQALLSVFLPGSKGKGQETPAGHILTYNVNGLRAWVFTHIVLYFLVFQLKLFPASILYDEWGALLVITNILGLLLALFAYIKAHYFPTHPDDCKFSGSFFYDLFMGIELNPRIGDFDFKLFHNGRPGIVAWNLINLSMAAKQFELHGKVTNSMIGVIILHCIYIVDFFWNEDWYLRTIDIAHDHFGFYLAWGDLVWLPFMYTLQSQYLVKHPVDLDNWVFIAIMSLGLAGYYIFRSVNDQKDKFRLANGKINIWGKPATFIKCNYKTSDGQIRTSLLLTSGWWGLSRHFNYVGDLMMSLAFCLCCGVGHLLPYFYIIYMTMLLVHRVGRDDQRLRTKYGESWKEYCKKVPAKIFPGIY